MKKIIKSKLFFGKGCFKNLFLWEIVTDDNDHQYQLIQHVRDQTQSKEVLLGWYRQKVEAFSEFKRVIRKELQGLPYDRVAFE